MIDLKRRYLTVLVIVALALPASALAWSGRGLTWWQRPAGKARRYHFAGDRLRLKLPVVRQSAFPATRALPLNKLSSVPTPGSAPPVVIPAGVPSVTVGGAGPLEIHDTSGRLLGKVGGPVRVGYAQDRYLYAGPGASGSSPLPVRIGNASGIVELPEFFDWNWNRTANLNSFRGVIEVAYSKRSRALWAVNELPLEDYLKGVSESSADAPVEHLKVMAVVARSYALYHLTSNRHQGEPFNLLNSRNGNGDDQIYQGYGAETRLPRHVAAVRATAGEVVTYHGQPVITPYSTRASGRTLSPREAGWNVDWPWVQSVPDPDTQGMTRLGHGVGLSGYGSRKRAERGDSHEAILAYYFPGTAVGRVDTAGKTIRIGIYSVK